jgi:steroid delta-isomerase-like uncharacterized protein
MTAEINKQRAALFYDLLNCRDFDGLDALLADDCLTHLPGVPCGPAGYRQMVESYVAAFDDLRHDVIEMTGEDDRVAVVTRTEGTHRGSFLGHPPTGRKFSTTGIDILRFRDGRMIERRGVFDTVTMLQQLGLYR